MFATLSLHYSSKESSFYNIERREDLKAYGEVLKKWTDIRSRTLESRTKTKPKPLIKQINMSFNSKSLVLPIKSNLKSIEKAIMEAYLEEKPLLDADEFLKVFEIDMREGIRRLEEEGIKNKSI